LKEKNYIAEDEIDLRELFKTIWDKKVFIGLFTFFVTLLSIVYVFIKNPTPIYKGSLLVEIGEIKTDNGMVLLEHVMNLKYIVEKDFSTNISIPSGSNKLLQIEVQNTSKDKIRNEIEKIYTKLLDIQREKLKFYKEYIPTKKIGDIAINNEPINKPKKRLIVVVSFVTGFILSIFLVFFIEFIKSFKEGK
jgi:LPS O-antigen subunit length determinant protein (WzzB/FepE family)